MIGRLNHVAIAVPDLAASVALYRDLLGAEVGAPQDEPEHGVTVVFIALPNTKIIIIVCTCLSFFTISKRLLYCSQEVLT